METGKSKVDGFVKKEKRWKEIVILLRELILDSGLEEEFKWNLPCYTFKGRNIAIIQTFKSQCALMFFEGYRLSDKKNLLKSPGANSQTAKRIEFGGVDEVLAVKMEVKRFIKEACKLSPLSLEEKPKSEMDIPKEFAEYLAKSAKLKKAFESLTPGRQRQYLMHFASAKQEVTRKARIEKYLPQILNGLGMNDSE